MSARIGSAYGRSLNGAGAGYGAVPNIDVSGMSAAARAAVGQQTVYWLNGYGNS